MKKTEQAVSRSGTAKAPRWLIWSRAGAIAAVCVAAFLDHTFYPLISHHDYLPREIPVATVFTAASGARQYFTNKGSYDAIVRDDLVDPFGTNGEGLVFDADLVTHTSLPFRVTGFASRGDCEEVSKYFSPESKAAASSLCLDCGGSHEIRVLFRLREME